MRHKRNLFQACLCFVCLLGPGSSELLAKDRGPTYFRQGLQALQKGQYYQSTVLLRKALKTLSHWGLVHLELAKAMRFNGDPIKDVERHLQKALKALPKNPRVHLFAGQFYEAQGKSAQALPYYFKAMKLHHFAPTACLRSSALLLRKKRGPQAIPCLRKLQTHRPLPANTHIFLARAHQQAGQWNEAAQQWTKALSKRPKSLTLMRKVFTFYAQNSPKQPTSTKRQWQRTQRALRRRMRKLLPRKKYRRLRPLLPSKQ